MKDRGITWTQPVMPRHGWKQMKLTVEMYGLSPYTEENKTEVEVREGASIPELITALGRKIPALEGNVKETGKDRLLETYGLYING